LYRHHHHYYYFAGETHTHQTTNIVAAIELHIAVVYQSAQRIGKENYVTNNNMTGLSLRPTFSKYFLLYLILFLSVGLISWL